jgi:hypothetical protein
LVPAAVAHRVLTQAEQEESAAAEVAALVGMDLRNLAAAAAPFLL